MDFFDCTLLKALYEHKNLTKASHILFISQPAITKRLKQLETEFEIDIIVRESKGISFTKQGEYLVQMADKMLLDYDLIKTSIKSIDNNEVSGLLKIGAIYILNEYKLPYLVKDFSEKYPKVTYNLLSQPNAVIFTKLNNNDLHVAFLRENFNWPYKKVFIESEPLYIVSKTEFKLSDLPDLPRIDPARNKKLNSLLEAWWDEHFSVPPNTFAAVSSSSSGLALVSQGLGYSIVPGSILKDYGDELYKIPLQHKSGDPLVRETWMYYKEEMLRLPQVKAFIDYTLSFYGIDSQ